MSAEQLLACPFCGSKKFDEPHDSSNTLNHFGPPDISLWHEDGCWLGRMTIIKLGPYEPGVWRNHAVIWNKRPFIASSSPLKEAIAPACVRCGERLTGVMALTATLCGLCADDDKNAATAQTHYCS